MHTGVGETAYASASQKWNGTIAALHQEPDRHERERADHQRRPAPPAASAPRSAPCSAPRCAPYSSAIPVRMKNAPDAVRHREVERPLQRPGLLDLVGGQRVGGDAHQLEEDEQVEEVAREREAASRRRGTAASARGRAARPRRSSATRTRTPATNSSADEQREPRAERIDRERDPDRGAAARGAQPPNQ